MAPDPRIPTRADRTMVPVDHPTQASNRPLEDIEGELPGNPLSGNPSPENPLPENPLPENPLPENPITRVRADRESSEDSLRLIKSKGNIVV